jgi:hypothetical protein
MLYKDYQQEICPMKGSAYCGYVVQMSRKVDDVFVTQHFKSCINRNTILSNLFPQVPTLCLLTFSTEPSLSRFQINPCGFCL